jgi:Domain of unknown function (DUF5666)
MKRVLSSAVFAALLAGGASAFALAQGTSDERAGAPAVKPVLPRLAIRAPSEVTGTITAIAGSVLTIRTRTGQSVQVDDSDAVRHQQTTVLLVGHPVDVRGTYDANRVLHAQAIVRAKPSPAAWRLDR